MLVSILHRATGTALAIGGGLIFTWWLVSAAMSAAAYSVFYHWIVQSDPMSTHEGAQHLVNLLAKRSYVEARALMGASFAQYQRNADLGQVEARTQRVRPSRATVRCSTT